MNNKLLSALVAMVDLYDSLESKPGNAPARVEAGLVLEEMQHILARSAASERFNETMRRCGYDSAVAEAMLASSRAPKGWPPV